MNCGNCKHWVFGRCLLAGSYITAEKLCNAWELSISFDQAQKSNLAPENVTELTDTMRFPKTGEKGEMSEGTRVPYSEAKKIADELLVLLGDRFERLEIAGSLRRKKELIGDIELVGIPKPVQVQGLFGTYEAPSIEPIVELMKSVDYTVEKAGDKYLKFVAENQMSVDLFMCGPKTWGCIFMIRTGSAEFTRRMMTKKSFRGWCPDSMQFCGGRLWWDGVALDTPEEEDVFREMGLPYMLPEEREIR